MRLAYGINWYILLIAAVIPAAIRAQITLDTIYPAAWAGNSINTVIFRKNSLTSNNTFQYTAFYDGSGFVMVGRRSMESKLWDWKKLNYQGNILDAHNSISIQLDGTGYLHMAWDHHNHPLKYFRSIAPGSLEFEPMQVMVGKDISAVSYPEFYRLPDGDLLFFYRNGASGNGNLVINSYSIKTASWTRLHHSLLDGEGQRNAYWQAAVDKLGNIHLSWTWRETPDVASNHDICYALSKDKGKSWQTSQGSVYTLPINAKNAEYIMRIPQNSKLINQTSMTCDQSGRPYIATYWKNPEDRAPQYRIVYFDGRNWLTKSLNFSNLNFSLSGMGTRSIPISRPQVLVWTKQKETYLGLIFRDEERGNKASLAFNTINSKNPWSILDLDAQALDRWEPTLDHDLWANRQILQLFILPVTQIDGEKVENRLEKPVSILEWKPLQ